jgi:hypothetical protein
MSSRFFRRRPRKAPAPSTVRIDVCPPDVCPPAEGLWKKIRRWLAREEAAAPGSPLESARVSFVAATAGLDGCTDLAHRARHARSLRELWHLRSELYTLIARHTSQHEAEARLGLLNAHFPTRTQRSFIQAADLALVR